ncbi:uncharacterized protein PV09_00087 [Verruconis gallopava]|uniref:Heterokaryon incompatibility domain-containing protein n=1 Tax=Verruconis gallopava TaxID=253628 RepID=A0A0D1Y274_9PEZI|nr:uncharacterized protein PV09_00087 [Verruconis gallopava]KIW09151.1 hypothetical protein PV09_00087 [Verruconis gallopava]
MSWSCTVNQEQYKAARPRFRMMPSNKMNAANWASPRSEGPFKYIDVDTSQHIVRLLRVFRRDDGTTEGQIQHFNIEKAPPYRALSYTWGPKTATEKICVDGYGLVIRRNLYRFLDKYKIKHEGEWIWIDQICINQLSTTERNHQVRLMSRIYRGAQEVIVWMNEEEHEIIENSLPCTEKCKRARHMGEKTCTWIQGLLQNRYWRRLWIIQEVLLAKSLTIWYCGEIISWAEVSAYARVGSAPLQLHFLVAESEHIKRKPLSLMGAIRYCYDSLCEDLRDKVYGLQALIQDEQQLDIDYAKSRDQVFVDTIMMILSTDLYAARIHDCMLQLARAMQIQNWCDKGSRPLEAIIELTKIYSAKASLSNWYREELQFGLMTLVEGDDAAFDEWYLWHRDYVVGAGLVRSRSGLIGKDLTYLVMPDSLDSMNN